MTAWAPARSIQEYSQLTGKAEASFDGLQAQRQAPAIIFLDEIDGLAPPRSSRTGGSDQIFASVVATLLALLDGLHDRGHVVVLAATNK